MCLLLYPVSAPRGMHARGSWPPQLGNAAQMSPALQQVCCAHRKLQEEREAYTEGHDADL